MDRRTLVTAVGAAVLTLAAASSAVAVNLGILDDPDAGPGDRVVQTTNGGVSGADASGATDEPEVVRIQVRDLPPTGSAATTGAAGGTPPATTAAATTAPASSAAVAGGDDHEDDHDDDHDERPGTRAGGRPRERHDDDDD